MKTAHPPLTDPFAACYELPVAGGTLHVARAGACPDEAETVVLAIHGITASLMTWRTIARELGADPGLCLLAPDLRGRGRSAALPGPYGVAAHVDDLIAVLDHAGVRRAILVGHSLGAYIAARLAADHPERAAALVLLDAGLPLPVPRDTDAMLETTMDITVMRLAITFPSADAYVAGWQAHPAFAHAWNDDLEAYARYDLIEDGRSARCVASAAAVRADSAEMMLDETTRLALDQVPTDGSVQMLRAERGLFDEQETPLIPADQLHAFAADHPEVHVEQVADVNHYTLVMGDSPGPARVAAAIERARETAR